jgi:hypothetical protein
MIRPGHLSETAGGAAKRHQQRVCARVRPDRLRVEFARVATVPCGVDWQETLAGCPPVRPAQFLFIFFWNKADEVEEEESVK